MSQQGIWRGSAGMDRWQSMYGPETSSSLCLSSIFSSRFYSLVSLVAGLASVLEPAGVLDGDGLAGSGLGTGALLMSSLGYTHCGE